jgi:hypothetical protein
MTTLQQLRQVLTHAMGFWRPWWLCGGWSLDVLARRVTRPHHDIELGVWREDQHQLVHLCPGCEMLTAIEGRWVPWTRGTPINLPMHQVKVRPHSLPGLPELEFFLNDKHEGAWRFRRDWRITRSLDKLIVRGPDDIPCLAPEVQFLHKAKEHRAQDDLDFWNHHQLMTDEGRAWLRQSLTVAHPGDPWLAML